MSTKLNIESIIDGSIEKGKLAESVQESLNKADNAMQSITINGESKTPDENGVVDFEKIYVSTLVYKATSKVEIDGGSFGAPIIKNEFEGDTGVIYFRGRITTIGQSAFANCSSLTSVVIPDSVTTIGNSAFSGCYSLTSVTIPDSVTTIGQIAFANCSSLTSVTIPDSVTTIGERAFGDCSSLTSVTIEDSVPTIGHFTFYGCSNLTSVYCKAITPPAGGINMFNGNVPGRKIYVPTESVEAYKSAAWWSNYANEIEGYRFDVDFNDYYTKSETDDKLNQKQDTIDDLDDIRDGADKGNTSVQSIKVNGVESEPSADGIVDLGNIYVTTLIYKSTSKVSDTRWNASTFGVPIIEYNFAQNTGVIHFRGMISAIGANAFQSSLITSVTIPFGAISIGNNAFSYCSKLTSVTIPNSVTYIGNSVFSGCSSLTSITIPDSVTQIGTQAFYNCTGLTKVYCKAITPPAGGSNMFYNNASGRKIYVPTESVEAYKSASYWSDYASYIVGYHYNVGFNDFYTKSETDNIIEEALSDLETSTVTESTVSGWGFTKNVGTVTSVAGVNPYDGGIEAIDLYIKLNAGRCTSVSSITNTVLVSGRIYIVDSLVTELRIGGFSSSSSYLVEEYSVHFKTSSSGSSISLPNTVKWVGEKPDTLSPNTCYELNIVKTTILGTDYFKAVLTPFS